MKLQKPVTSQVLRQSFIDFFASKDHRFVPSSPVVPHDDPTLLFANAGMNQFKAILLGGDNPTGLKRAANSQKCIRVSGKHNDLDVVGRDSYHHTFFEMLGNWSFGDYFKKEAIAWSWELLTEVWGLDKSKLWATVYEEDDEALELWKTETDIDHSHILKSGKKDNFWEMGEVGPCGPCTEVHYDFGPESDPRTGEPGYVAAVNVDGCERFIEIWNNVFMQYERIEDGSLRPLPNQHVDTGMGFERILRVMQGVKSNYDTDVFQPLLKKIAELTGVAYDPGEKGTPHRVIADHVRTLSFSIADGATPSNEGRGYVLRRLLRRAARFARELGARQPLVCEVVPTLVEIMGDAFPEIKARQAHIITVIRSEEERFGRTLDQGLDRFRKAAESAVDGVISGDDVFKLYDTYGFPVDLTEQMALERGLRIDEPGYKKAMEEQKERARAGGKFTSIFNSLDGWTLLQEGNPSFVGYECDSAEVKTLRYREHEDDFWIVTDRTPFYPEMGGQIGDIGVLESKDVRFQVLDTQKVNDAIVHRAKLVEGSVTDGALAHLTATVSSEGRAATRRNHSGVHLLHAALREVLGEHVQQQGSWVGPDAFRFDFVHTSALSESEILRVEDIVNAQIRQDLSIVTQVLAVEEAKKTGAMALFGEKYGDTVRVISMESFSKEFCGGTHASSTGQIGLLRILREASISAGVRRIEGVCGEGAFELLRKQATAATRLAQTLKCADEEIGQKVSDLSARLRAAEKEIEGLKVAALSAKVPAILAKSVDLGKAKATALDLTQEAGDAATFNRLVDAIEQGLGNGRVVLLAAGFEGKVTLVALVSQDLSKACPAGPLVNAAAAAVEGKGGGKPNRAQAGGKDPAKIPNALQAFMDAAKAKLA
ncbi:MAG: alanine--tRNA ligase [Fibrobacterota bacterium]|nr:MAG: alanine--tRNA ligase [Fibrobacterota bacterium]